MTSTSYTVSGFEENFRRLTHDVCEVFANIDHMKWARAYFPNILNQHNVPIITLTEAIRDYIQWTFVERSLMTSKIPGAILNHLITCTRTLFDHIYFSGRLTTVLTSYVDVMLHKRMQKSVWWQAK
uniref:Uncharacterized protein n=1 Tax=Lactuca sativa TaxID=4236 RepID=A0A9R1ULI8_LACSA|nr:hypothetical protein LSAT_V11C800416650 [Lactuca sativa]